MRHLPFIIISMIYTIDLYKFIINFYGRKNNSRCGKLKNMEEGVKEFPAQIPEKTESKEATVISSVKSKPDQFLGGLDDAFKRDIQRGKKFLAEATRWEAD